MLRVYFPAVVGAGLELMRTVAFSWDLRHQARYVPVLLSQ